MSLSVGYQLAGILSVGPQDTADPSSDEFNQTLTPGALTVAGSTTIRMGQEFEIVVGALTVAGSDFGLTIDNDAKQFVTVTDVSKIGLEVTFFDALTGVTPEVGDQWWVPTTSNDGGTFTLLGDGTFTIGTPTSGTDVIADVSYYDTSADQWHGPADVSVIDFPNVLVVEPTTQPAIVGNAFLWLHTSLEAVTVGALTIAGQDIFKGLVLPLDTAGALTVAGQTVDITQFVLSIDTPGQLTVAGIEVPLDQVFDPLTVGQGTIAGSTVNLIFGAVLNVTPGVLTVAGQVIGRNVVYDTMVLGALVLAGQTVVFTGQASDPVDKPDVTSGTGTRNIASGTGTKNIISSQAA